MSKLLTVDDHADIRQMLRLTMGKAHQLFEADNGVNALHQVHIQRPDLVVLDVPYQSLRRQGCHSVQGYLIGKPMPAETFFKWAYQRLAGTE